MYNEQLLKVQTLYKLYRKRRWGGKHTALRNLRVDKRILKELNNLGFIKIKMSTGERHISLNSHKKKEILDYIIKVLKIDPNLLE
tara:strand:+ start:84 stop:338 length:255 start_codon:yes stop_codon:yes gene_type:complete